MPTFVLSPWYADVANNAANTPAWHEHSRAFPPDTVELGQEKFIVRDVTKLPGVVVVALKIPVRWRRYYQVD